MRDSQNTMDQIMDRRRILKTKAFNIDNQNGTSVDFESWQRSNPSLRVVDSNVLTRVITSPPVQRQVQAPSYIETKIVITYEEIENKT